MRDLIDSNDPNGHGNQFDPHIWLPNALVHIKVNSFTNLLLGFI